MQHPALTPPTRRTLALACACLLASAPALAQSSPWYLGVAQTFSHDSNIRRGADNQVLPTGASRSDTISSTALLGGLDQPIGRQRVFGSANISTNRYANNNSLNNTSYNLNLGLDWATVNRLSGSLSAAIDQQSAKYETLNANNDLLSNPNELRTQQLDAKVRLGVVTRYTLEAGLGYLKRSYSAPSYSRYEFSQNNASVGLRWRSSDLLSLGVALRLTRAEYPRFLALAGGAFQSDTLSRQDIDFTASWKPSGASDLNLRLSPTRSRYDRNSAADFSGLTGSLNWVWRASGKTTLTTLLSRDTGQSADAFNAGISGVGLIDQASTTTALGLRATHELTGKIGLTASLDHARRSLQRDTTLGSVNVRNIIAKDTTTALRLGARWLPTRSTQLSCNLGTERRSSDGLLAAAYSANTFGCTGQIILQ